MLAAGQAPAQTVNRCTDAKGQTVFQQQACAPGTGGVIKVSPVNSFEPFPALVERMNRNTTGAMTEEDMRRELGNPTVTNTDIVNGVVTQQHVYRYGDGSSRFVYTRNGEVWAAQVRPAVNPLPTQPCYSAGHIAGERTSASSITLSPAQRQTALDRISEMEKCRR
jgi:hypothetical protein